MLHSWNAGVDNAYVRQADAARSAWGRRRADVPPGVKPLPRSQVLAMSAAIIDRRLQPFRLQLVRGFGAI